jgi:hypothetical protein
MANVALSATITANSNENGNYSGTPNKSEGCFVDFIGQGSTNADKFGEKISELKSDSEGVWLVIGESLGAKHAPVRFSKKNWIFLDPCDHRDAVHETAMRGSVLNHSRIGIRGFIKDLNELQSLRGAITYIVDDPHILCGEKYSDYHSSGTTFNNLMILHDFLAKGGIITTSIRVLNTLSRADLEKIREKFNIKWSYEECDFSKPYKDCPFSEDVTKGHFEWKQEYFKPLVRLWTSLMQGPEAEKFQHVNRLEKMAEILPFEKCKDINIPAAKRDEIYRLLAEKIWGSKTFGQNYENWSRPDVDKLNDVDESVLNEMYKVKEAEIKCGPYRTAHDIDSWRVEFLRELHSRTSDLVMFNGSLFFIKKD